MLNIHIMNDLLGPWLSYFFHNFWMRYIYIPSSTKNMSGTIPPFSKPWHLWWWAHPALLAASRLQPSEAHVLVDGQLRSDADPLPPELEVDNRFPSTNCDHQPVLDRMIIQFLFSIILNPVLDNPRSIVVIKRFVVMIGYCRPIFFHQSTGVKDKMLKWIPAEMIQGVSSSWCPPRKDGFWNCHCVLLWYHNYTLRLRLDRIVSTLPFRNSCFKGIPLKNPGKWNTQLCAFLCMAFDCCITLW